jgi:microcin C transport system substrate-binding protein
MDVFDFDIISNRSVGSEAPGTELLERFGSKSANVEGSGNVLGLKDPAVDALLDKVVSATTRPELVVSLRALDRVLRHGHYVVPHWYGAVHRVSWRAAVFDRPVNLPRYYQPEALVTMVWWSKSAGGVSAATAAGAPAYAQTRAQAHEPVGNTAVKKGP